MAEMWQMIMKNTQQDAEIDAFPESAHTRLDVLDECYRNVVEIYKKYVHWSLFVVDNEVIHVDDILREELQNNSHEFVKLRYKLQRFLDQCGGFEMQYTTPPMIHNFIHVQRNQCLIELYSLIPDGDFTLPRCREFLINPINSDHFKATIEVKFIARRKELLQKIHKSQLNFLINKNNH